MFKIGDIVLAKVRILERIENKTGVSYKIQDGTFDTDMYVNTMLVTENALQEIVKDEKEN
jgi:hypothetical protein